MGVDTEQGWALSESFSSLALLVPLTSTPLHLHVLATSPLSSCILRGQLPSTHHYTERIANLSDHSDKAATNDGSTLPRATARQGGLFTALQDLKRAP